MDEPWAHDAEPLRLQWEMARARPGAREFHQSQLLIWHYKDALRRGDSQAAARAQQAVRAFVEQQSAASRYFIPGNVHLLVVWQALDHDRLDDAAGELTYWLTHIRTDDVEDDNAQRTNARQLLSCQLRFLKHPASGQHPSTPAIKSAARRLADKIEQVLTADHYANLHLLQ
ncbi:hypothetical protein [Geodermatophilus sp. URMC 65]